MRNRGKAPSKEAPPSLIQPVQRVSARTLLGKEHTGRIEEEDHRLLKENPTMGRMAARNAATTMEVKRVQEESPEVWAALEQCARGIREAKDKDYADQPAEALKRYECERR